MLQAVFFGQEVRRYSNPASAGEAMEPVSLLFTNARIFDGSGRPPFPGEVFVEKNRIEAVSDSPSRINRRDAEVVDCGGRTLMPGLVEAHAHLSWPSSVGRIINTMMLPPEEHLLVTARNAKVTLDAGFTQRLFGWIARPAFRNRAARRNQRRLASRAEAARRFSGALTRRRARAES